MKKVCKFVLYYVLALLFFTFLGVFINFLYDSSLRIVAGVPFSFNKFALLKGCFLGLEVGIIFSPLFLCNYRIKTGSRTVPLFISYIFLGIFSWFLLFPAVILCENKISSNLLQKKTELTANFFRESESRYVYFVTDEKNNKAKIISVEKDSPSEKNAAFGVFELTEEFINDSEPFSDPLIKKSYDDFPHKIKDTFSRILYLSRDALNKSFLHWIVFASFGILLWSIYGFTIFSPWKLINYFMVFFLTAVILFLNYFYYNERFVFLHNLISDSFFGISGIELMHGILNAALSFILIVLGLIIYGIRRRKL